jgi:hypothetical protein
MAEEKVTPGIEEKSIIEDRKNGPVNDRMKKLSFKQPVHLKNRPREVFRGVASTHYSVFGEVGE